MEKMTCFKIVDSRYLDGDIPYDTSYWISICQLIRFLRAPSNVFIYLFIYNI